MKCNRDCFNCKYEDCILTDAEAVVRWSEDKQAYMREYMRKYYEANKERMRKRANEWYHANREKALAQRKKSYLANREKILAKQRERRHGKDMPSVRMPSM